MSLPIVGSTIFGTVVKEVVIAVAPIAVSAILNSIGIKVSKSSVKPTTKFVKIFTK